MDGKHAGGGPPLPEEAFDVIYADPPWRYESGSTLKKWAIEEHYPTMDLESIKKLDVPAAEDCILYLWATSPKLQEALDVLNSWGFDYRTSAIWHKTNGLGMGHYFRIDHELILVGVRGSGMTPADGVLKSSVFRAEKGEHSEKPDKVRWYIEKAHPDAEKIELFSREARVGWTMWGDEAPSNPQQTLCEVGNDE